MKLFARDIHTLDAQQIDLNDSDMIAEMRTNIQQGDSYIIKNNANKELLQRIRDYILHIGRSSLPNYYPILPGTPNFHRMNANDDRAYVKGCFHQFCFFPWNQDIFGLFERFKSIYHLKNQLSNLPPEKFLTRVPEENCIARLAFQFYPKGSGMLNAHADPIDHHQLTVPIMLLSQKGEDYHQGGGFVVKADGSKVILDDYAGWGDAIYFNAQVVHGVETIDPDSETDWLAFQGRLMLLFSVNKIATTHSVPDSIDFEKAPLETSS